MWPKKLIWQLYFSYLLIMGLPVFFVTWYASHSFSAFFMSRTIEDLKARAFLIGSQVGDRITRLPGGAIDSLCKTIAREVSTRFTVISPTGKVLGDSEKNPDSMENHANRAEVIAAFAGNIGVSKRFSYTMHEDMIYAAVPVYSGKTLAAVVRTSFPVMTIRAELHRLYLRIIFAVLFMALLAALVSYLVSRKISRPIATMKNGAQRFAAGDFSMKLPLSGYRETDHLAGALNEMAQRLSDTITTITAQRNQLDAVLSSMVEGVIAVDSHERIITINRAAAALFGIDQQTATGKLVAEVLRHADIQDFLAKTLGAPGNVEGEAAVLPSAPDKNGNGERILQLHGSGLRNPAGKSIGGLMVVNDITQIKKLENLRKDFVANVSHELRTPLTSIKGFVETLLSGALNNPGDAQRFLGIVTGQVDRLNTIVEDLLTLSRIEREAEQHALEFAESPIGDVLATAIQTCGQKAQRKDIAVELSCDKTLASAIDPMLLEQAVVNLLDNAVNYSDEHKRIVVAAAVTKSGDEIAISVKDEGIGIPPAHLGRLFERFYRVDKARSRKVGGTGLGLSIVKHIALAHGGRVGVESEPGKGSVFYIYLPRARRKEAAGA